jgi:hypothetical protein
MECHSRHISRISNHHPQSTAHSDLKSYRKFCEFNERGLIKQNDSRTHSYDVLRIYTMNLLRKIYRENNESLA